MSNIIFSNIRKSLLLISFSVFSMTIAAQESEEVEGVLTNISLNGSVDTYFRTNFNGLNSYEYAADGTTILAGPEYPASSFASGPGFAIGMANIILGYEGEKVGFVADLVFGPRGKDAVFRSTGSSNIVNQLYVYYQIDDNVKLTLGNFNTFLGYEVISPVANFHYSTSYMFSYGPFSHTGLKADFSIDDNWSAMLAVMNPTDYTEFNPFGLYSFGGQLGYSTDAGSAFLNLVYGEQAPDSDATFQIDLTTGWDLSDTFYFGINSTYNNTSDVGFYGLALYPQIQATEDFAIGFRAEYFEELENDVNAAIVYGSGVRAMDFTLTGSYVVGNLIIKPEVRLDKIEKDVFLNQDLESTSNLSSFILAAIYAF